MLLKEFIDKLNIAGIEYARIISQTKKKEFVYSRAFITECLRENGYTLKDISKVINRKDHTTILNLININKNDNVYKHLRNELLKKQFNGVIPFIKKGGDMSHLEQYLKTQQERYPDKTISELRREYSELLKPEALRKDLDELHAEIKKISNFIGYFNE